MTKVINKKALMVLLTLVLAFCWLSVPASAAEIDENMGYCAENAKVISITDLDELQGRTIYGTLLEELKVYAGKAEKDGTITPYTFGGSPLIVEGPANILNCYLPNGYYQAMINEGMDYYVCYLTFKARGINLKRFTVEVDGQIVINQPVTENSATQEKLVTVAWATARKETSTFEVVVYDNKNVSSAAWGHVYR